MLVLSRKKGESIVIGDNIEVTVIKLDDGTVKLAVNAPKDISIFRKELLTEVESENKAAVNVDLNFLKFMK